MKKIFKFKGYTESSRLKRKVDRGGVTLCRTTYENRNDATTTVIMQVGRKKELKDDVKVQVTIIVETIGK